MLSDFTPHFAKGLNVGRCGRKQLVVRGRPRLRISGKALLCLPHDQRSEPVRIVKEGCRRGVDNSAHRQINQRLARITEGIPKASQVQLAHEDSMAACWRRFMASNSAMSSSVTSTCRPRLSLAAARATSRAKLITNPHEVARCIRD